MSSQAQKLRGYPLPELTLVEETQSFCVTIPAGDEYRDALLGQLTDLGKWWFWKRDAERPSAATDAAMTWRLLYTISENCGDGGFLMTPEEFYDANKRSIYDAWNDIAKQIVSGRTTNIGVDSEGNVTNPSTGGTSGLPTDDPETERDETAAANMGGAMAVAKAIELYFDKIDAAYGYTNGSPIVDQDQMAAIISAYFPIDEDILPLAITSYYLYRSGTGAFYFDPPVGLSRHFYCKGSNGISFNRWLVDSSGFGLGQYNQMSQLAQALTQKFWDDYFAYGIKTPSTNYLDAPCTPIADEAILMSAQGTTYYTVGSWKDKHRMDIIISGLFTDSSDGSLQDPFYYIPPTGNKEFLGSGGLNIQAGFGVSFPSVNQVPYRSDHTYTFTLDTSADGGAQFTSNRDSRMSAADTTGDFTVVIKDLGQFSL